MTTAPTAPTATAGSLIVRGASARQLVDALVLATLLLVAMWPLADAYAGPRWFIAAVAGIGMGLGVMALSAKLAWGPGTTVLALVGSYLVLGPALAAPSDSSGGVVPTLAAERTLVMGSFESWRTVLTLPLPLGSDQGELVVPLVLAIVGAVCCATLLWRSNFGSSAWLTVIFVFAASAALGAEDVDVPILRGLLLIGLLIVWTRWRRLDLSRRSWARRVVWGGAVLGLSAAASWGVTSVALAPEREVLREHVEPPLARLDLRSPLSRYRDFYRDKERRDLVLFSFSGLPAGSPVVRLASMDRYDGLVWNVVDTTAASSARSTSGPGTARSTSAFGPAPAPTGSTFEVTVGAYRGTWVPTVGDAIGARLEGGPKRAPGRQLLLNPVSGALAVLGEIQEGDRLEVGWVPHDAERGDVAGAEVDRSIPVDIGSMPSIGRLDRLAQRWVLQSGARTDYDRLVALEQRFSQEGYFNDGLPEDAAERGYSPSGHSAGRLADLVADEERMVGNDEQYAAAMAYAAQRLGMPARVVLGFEDVGTDLVVTGDDIAAWVEVPFVGHGWVRFDPTPDEDRKPPPLQDNPNPKPQPYVVQPPTMPQEPADLQGVPPSGAGQDRNDSRASGVLMVLLWLLILLLGSLLISSPIWGVILAKSVRRRRRRSSGALVDRCSGGWRELTDRARDLGTRLPAGDTRRENALTLESRYPAATPLALATEADRFVFGPGEPSPEAVEAYWADIDSALRRMRRTAPWWRRCLAVVSPVSLPWGRVGRRYSGPARRLAARVGSSIATRAKATARLFRGGNR